jgi:hypothetical protein
MKSLQPIPFMRRSVAPNYFTNGSLSLNKYLQIDWEEEMISIQREMKLVLTVLYADEEVLPSARYINNYFETSSF